MKWKCLPAPFVVIACAASCALLLSHARTVNAADLVDNGGFETGDFSGWTATESDADAAWSADNGGFQTLQAASFYGTHTGSYTAEFGGFESYGGFNDPTGDTIAQSLATAPGQSYMLSFWVNDQGNSPAHLSASWNGATLLSLDWPSINTTGTWTKYSYTVQATGTSTPLEFGGWGPNSWTALDDISVTPVPEPSAPLLCGVGALALFAIRRRVRAVN